MYADQGQNVCLYCSTGCISCTSKQNCLKCYEPKYTLNTSTDGIAICSLKTITCGNSEYYDVTSNACYKCAVECITCSSKEICTTC